MDKALYVAMTGAQANLRAQAAVAHNLANVETTGFKKSRVDFADIVAGSAYSNPKLIQGIGATVEAIFGRANIQRPTSMPAENIVMCLMACEMAVCLSPLVIL